MAVSDKYVHLALTQRLDTLALPLARENVQFTPPSAGADPPPVWIREKFIPANAEGETLGTNGFTRITGVFLVDIYTPDGIGIQLADDTFQAVLSAYPRGGQMSSSGVTVRITRTYRGAGISEDPWYHVPVTVEFRADVSA